MECHICSVLLPAKSNNSFAFELGNDLKSIGISIFSCVRSSILTNSVEIFAAYALFVLLQIHFYFLVFEKYNSNIGKLSSRKLHSGTFHCPGMDLAGTRDISFHSGTVPGNPGHLVTLHPSTVSKFRDYFSRKLKELYRQKGTFYNQASIPSNALL